LAEAVAGKHDLPDDFARSQIPHQSLGAGVAKTAGQGAADLTGDTQGAAILFGDVDSLDLLAAAIRIGCHAKKPFARAVGRELLSDDLGPVDGEMTREP